MALLSAIQADFESSNQLPTLLCRLQELAGSNLHARRNLAAVLKYTDASDTEKLEIGTHVVNSFQNVVNQTHDRSRSLRD